MKKSKEQEMILIRELKSRQKLSLSQAMNLLSVSESTARRLFVKMEQNGSAIRSHGCIVSASESYFGSYVFELVSEQYVTEKKMIAARAVSLLEDNDVVYLDAGSTLYWFTLAAAAAIERGELKNITVFTNSLVNLNILSEYVTVNLIGGEYRANRRDFSGYIAEESIKKLHFKKSFLGSDGYSPQLGFTATDFQTARINSLAAKNSEETIMLVDSSKFRRPSVVSIFEFSDISSLVTDDKISDTTLHELEKNNVQAYICDRKSEKNGQNY